MFTYFRQKPTNEKDDGTKYTSRLPFRQRKRVINQRYEFGHDGHPYVCPSRRFLTDRMLRTPCKACLATAVHTQPAVLSYLKIILVYITVVTVCMSTVFLEINS